MPKPLFHLFNLQNDNSSHTSHSNYGLDCLSTSTLEALSSVFNTYDVIHRVKNRIQQQQTQKESALFKFYDSNPTTKNHQYEAYYHCFQEENFWNHQERSHPYLQKTIAMLQNLVRNEGRYFFMGADSLRYLHSHSLKFIADWLNYAKDEIKHKHRSLPSGFLEAFQTYLRKLEKQLLEEERVLRLLSFNRFNHTLLQGTEIEDDDLGFFIQNTLRNLGATLDFNQKFTRKGWTYETFDYFYQQWSDAEREQLHQRLLPSRVKEYLFPIKPKFNFLFTEKEPSFFIQQLYPLASLQIELRQIHKLLDTPFASSWDHSSQISLVEKFISTDNAIQKLIESAHENQPKGIFARLFQRQKRRAYHDYISHLHGKRREVNEAKVIFLTTMEEFAKETGDLNLKKVDTLDFSVIQKVRAFVEQQAGFDSYLNHSDVFYHLVQACLTPDHSPIPWVHKLTPELHSIYIPDVAIANNLFTVARACANENEQSALDTLYRLMMGDESTYQSNVKRVLQSLYHLFSRHEANQNKNYYLQQIKLLIEKYVVPHCYSTTCPAYLFLANFDKEVGSQIAREWLHSRARLATDNLIQYKKLIDKDRDSLTEEECLLIYRCIDNIRAASTIEINYYQQLVDITRKFIHYTKPRAESLFTKILLKIDDTHLTAEYGIKLFTAMLTKGEYNNLLTCDYFKIHISNHLLLQKIKELFIKYLIEPANHHPAFYQVCAHFFPNDEAIYHVIDQHRLAVIQQFKEATSYCQDVDTFVEQIEQSPYPTFPLTEQAQMALQKIVGEYNEAWGEKQVPLVSRFLPSEHKKHYFTHWTTGFIQGRHKHLIGHPLEHIDVPTVDELLAVYGKEHLSQHIYPLMEATLDNAIQCLPKPSNLRFMKKHVPADAFKIAEVAGLNEKLSRIIARDDAMVKSQQQIKTLQSYLDKREFDRVNSLLIEKSQLLQLHSPDTAHPEYIKSQLFLLEAAKSLLAKLKSFLMHTDAEGMFAINEMVTNLPQFPYAYEFKTIFEQRYDIFWHSLRFTYELTDDCQQFQVNQQLYFPLTQVSPELFYYFLNVPQDLRTPIINSMQTLIHNLGPHFPQTHALKAFIHALDKDNLNDATEEGEFVFYHQRFKIVIDSLKALYQDKQLPVKEAELKEHIQVLMQHSPYCQTNFQAYWQSLIAACLKKPRLIHFKALVETLASDEQQEAFRFLIVRSDYASLKEGRYAPMHPAPGSEFALFKNKFLDEMNRKESSVKQHFSLVRQSAPSLSTPGRVSPLSTSPRVSLLHLGVG